MSYKFINIDNLIHLASEAKERAYCPYSKFRVGAALVTESGDVYTGCNVENACYPVTICAERTAICKAVSEGHLKFKAVAVITDKTKMITPCGMCRQALREFGEDITIYCASKNGAYETSSIQDLLPHSFGPEDLTTE